MSPSDVIDHDPNGARADRLTIVFRPVDLPESESDIGPAVVMVIDPRGKSLALEQLRQELEELAAGPDGNRRSYMAEMRYGHTSWGADGATALFLLTIAGQVAGQFLYDGLGRIAAAFRGEPEVRPITEREAEFWAAVMVGARFESVDTMRLVVTEMSLRDNTASVGMKGPDGSTFRAELELTDGLIAVGEVERTYPD